MGVSRGRASSGGGRSGSGYRPARPTVSTSRPCLSLSVLCFQVEARSWLGRRLLPSVYSFVLSCPAGSDHSVTRLHASPALLPSPFYPLSRPLGPPVPDAFPANSSSGRPADASQLVPLCFERTAATTIVTPVGRRPGLVQLAYVGPAPASARSPVVFQQRLVRRRCQQWLRWLRSFAASPANKVAFHARQRQLDAGLARVLLGFPLASRLATRADPQPEPVWLCWSSTGRSVRPAAGKANAEPDEGPTRPAARRRARADGLLPDRRQRRRTGDQQRAAAQWWLGQLGASGELKLTTFAQLGPRG